MLAGTHNHALINTYIAVNNSCNIAENNSCNIAKASGVNNAGIWT